MVKNLGSLSFAVGLHKIINIAIVIGDAKWNKYVIANLRTRKIADNPHSDTQAKFAPKNSDTNKSILITVNEL